jgi:transposase InsO family protein
MHLKRLGVLKRRHLLTRAGRVGGRRRIAPPRGSCIIVIQANQYRATRYHMVWARPGAVASMSRTGNCYDNNAPVERCFSSLKNELVRHRQFQNQAEARQAIVASTEECSPCQHWHQALGYRSPEEVEQMAGEFIQVSVISGPPQVLPSHSCRSTPLSCLGFRFRMPRIA